MLQIYKEWKEITDKMYASQISEETATEMLIDLLEKYGTKRRPDNHTLKAKSYFVYDKDKYSDPNKENALGLGLVYIKPDENKTKTQDIFIVTPEGRLNKYYNEEKMKKDFPAMKGVHKNNLPI